VWERIWLIREVDLSTERIVTGLIGFREAIGQDLSGVELFVDFDGTLARIVDDPAKAVATPGVIDALDRLREDLESVTVVSGRPVEFLRSIFGDSAFRLVGLYGIEEFVDGAVVVDAVAESWGTLIGHAAAAADAAGIVGMEVEHKRLSLTLHYRATPEIADAVADWARAHAAESGLEARRARLAVELHPRVDIDKGVAILARVGAATRTVVFVGDDVGDLAGFDALDALEQSGLVAVRVAVASGETPSELIDRADIVLDDTDAVLHFLAT